MNIRFTITKNEGFEGEVSICRKRVLKSTKKLRLSYESQSFFVLLHARIGGEAAVDGQADAGDETGSVIVQQEQLSPKRPMGVAARILLVRAVGVPSSL